MLLRITLLLLVVTCIGLLREIEAFLPILPVKVTGINIEGSSVGLRKNEYLRSADHFEVFTKRDEAAVSVGDSNCNPPGFLEPGGAPAVAFSQDVDMDIVYREAIKRTLLWVALAGMFGAGIWTFVDSDLGEEFFAGYLVEQSLSVDNLFVFLLLFDFFKVPMQSQDKILNWGIYGAIVMRAAMIGLGAVAIENFRPILLVFASILVYSSGKFLIGGDDDEEEDMNENAIIKLSKKLIDSTETMDGDKFFTIVEGVKKATPLFLCMIAVEISDVVFAVDSIPAVFGVTEEPLVVFSSNMFAIMGLRSLYTILSKAATDLKYLEPAVAVVLGFIGCKMVAEFCGYHLPTEIALTVVASFLGAGVFASILDKQANLENP